MIYVNSITKTYHSFSVQRCPVKRSVDEGTRLHILSNFMYGSHLPLVQLVYPLHHKHFSLGVIESDLLNHPEKVIKTVIRRDYLYCKLKQTSLGNGPHPFLTVELDDLAQVLQLVYLFAIVVIFMQIG